MKLLPIAGGIALSVLGVALAHAQELPNARAVYDANCAVCHATGIGGAPRTGDAQAWSARIGVGINALYASAIKGKRAMPPKGGNASLTDAQVMAAVNHIVGLTTVPNAASKPAQGSSKALDPAKGGVRVVADGTKGKLVYQAVCAACHTSGLAGAPKLGDGAAWASRISAGTRPMFDSAIKGKGAMPPKGGNASLPDADVRAAVEFMLAQVQSGTALPATGAAAPKSAVSPVPAPAVTVTPAASVPVTVAPGPAVYESSDPNAFNRLMVAPGRRNLPPAEDSIHDPASPGTALLQAPLLSFQLLPRANHGNYVNWVAALGKKQIQPRWDTRDTAAEPTVMDLNIVREVKGSMPDVVFPHKQHTEWLDCSNCHPAIFTPQKGANQISMAAIMLGQKCGVCHGKVAFPVSECRLCHARQKSVGARAAEAPPAGGGRQ
ncbi:MAG: c-type cytochrome [Betaproteobacteria bacterium]|nr:c-type cytochrome [Betaproteobacteria bacterium]